MNEGWTFRCCIYMFLPNSCVFAGSNTSYMMVAQNIILPLYPKSCEAEK